MVHDMTQGSVRGHVVRMASFVFAGLAIQTLYSLVDIYWVGRLGQQAVAAVALSTNLMFFSLALTQTLSVGCVALVSQAAGRKAHDDVQRIFNQGQSLSLFAGFVFLAITLASMRSYANTLSGDAHTAELARQFLLYFIPALALQFTMVGLASALRGIGDMKPGLLAQTGSVLLNMVLAPFLIFGWVSGKPLGVAGAALSTLVATLAAVVGLSLYLVRKETYLRLRVSQMRPDFRLWWRMISIGLPAGAEFLLMSVSFGFIYGVMRPFGAQAQAGFGIGSRVMQAGFMPAVAMSFGVAAVVGQNFGSQRMDRVREAYKEAAKIIIVLMLLFTLVSHVAPARMVAVFSKEAPVIEVGAEYLRIASYNYVAAGLVMTAAGIFQGLGNTVPSLIASASRVGLFVGSVLALSRMPEFTRRSIWFAAVAAALVQFALIMILIRRELRLRATMVPVPPTVAAAGGEAG